MLDGSWRTYEKYTAPLGVGFMVQPGHHYGPSVDGYEYSPWGTSHFADRDGVGVDRSTATGTGYAGQYAGHWAEVEEARQVWASLVDSVDPARHARVAELFEEQLRSAREWRDQINSYFFRQSGVPDERGRALY